MADGWQIISPFGCMSFFLYILCIPHAVSLQIAILAQSAISAIAAGDASQHKLHMFSCCVVLDKSWCAIWLIVRVLLVTWHVAIN